MKKKPVAKKSKPVAAVEETVVAVPAPAQSKSFGDSQAETIRMNLIDIAPAKQQVRPFDPEDPSYTRKVEFARSNRKWINPITVVKDGQRYLLVAGRNRFEASKACEWVEINATVYESLDLSSRMQIGLIENLGTKSMTPTEISNSITVILREDPTASIGTIAQGMNCTPNTVRNYIGLGGLVPAAQKRTHKGEIPAANAFMLAKLPADVQSADDGAWIESAATCKTVKFVKAVQDYLKTLKADATGTVRKSSKAAAESASQTVKPLGQRKLEGALAEAMKGDPAIIGAINESFQDGLIDGLRIALGMKPLLPATCAAGYQPKPASFDD